MKECLEKRLDKYGKVTYAYSVLNKKNLDEMIIISDFPNEVVDNYLENKFQNIDPLIVNALSGFSPFSWDEDAKINSIWTVRRVFEKIKTHNIIRGHAFVLHDHKNNLAMLFFYIDKFLDADFNEFIEEYNDELQGVLIYIHKMLLNVYEGENEVNSNVLSSREAEVLYWCSKGMTYAEVSNALGVSVSTIKFHMGKVVKKMGVKNAKHAISLGNELNIISPPSLK
ncbi:LuxR family transcriptional regulator [Pantoea cypripedii]|uniref:LuxR family transcriptional regulator n=1 Tax=Pantoea cypripedii TaxID=55209 RepID=UPI001AE69DE7